MLELVDVFERAKSYAKDKNNKLTNVKTKANECGRLVRPSERMIIKCVNECLFVCMYENH